MPDEKPVTVPAIKPYTRVIKARLVTFTCCACHREITVEQYPGPKPIVCADCWPEYRKRKKTAAQRRRRAAKRKK
jgi:hypothetical protein